MHAFVARELTWVGQDLQGNERIAVEVLDRKVVLTKLVAGEFADGKTIATLGTFFLREERSNGSG